MLKKLYLWLFILVLLGVVVAVGWASDNFTMQGERTVFTVECRDGAWDGVHCKGRLVAAERYRFRALPPHQEVIFWTAGSREPSSKFSGCAIQDGRNWNCKATPDAARTVTHEMVRGQPVPDPGVTKPFHAVPKWRWWLLTWGIAISNESLP